jgi:selenide,water dikinase
MSHSFDLLTTVEQGGCSAKLPAQLLDKILKKFPSDFHQNLLVGLNTSDDAAVWKIDQNIAIIQTADFFPPLCSDPFEFGQIAAANALSDVYAMGGSAIIALNLVMFPSDQIDISVLKEILKGGVAKVKEAGAVLAGGHTIDDYPPKYGLAVTGTVHPGKVITNDNAKAGEILILSKPIGTGTIIAGQRLQEVSKKNHQNALECMKLLNKSGAEVMQKYNVRCATDITGFSLLGHALEMAEASNLKVKIKASQVPLLEGAYKLTDMGCIPGAAFRNLKYVENRAHFSQSLDYNLKMLMLDAQTSGGLLISCEKMNAGNLIEDFKLAGYPDTAIIGEVIQKMDVGEPSVLVE